MAGEWLAYGEIALATAGLAPFAIHRLSCSSWMKQQLECPETDSNLEITILLPVWNEGLIIEKKLANLSKQNIKSRILVIDSASTDDTVKKTKTWLEDYPDAFIDSKVIVMEKRLGKTAAVKLALDELESHNGIILMTDADATIMENGLARVRRWFSNSVVGAVGGTPKRQGEMSQELTHRDMYTMIRTGESSYDSTPFLEGSLIAWRAGAVKSTELYAGANADDSQIATAVRLKGLRSIQDPSLFFKDQMPTTKKGQRRQKVRRAQGLIRLLSRNRRNWFSAKLGRFSKILRRNAWMHIGSPLAITGAAMLALLRNITYFPDTNLMAVLSAIEIYCLVSWLLARTNRGIFGTKTAGTILVGLENLVAAIIFSARGKSLHMWEQHTDVRSVLSKE